MSYILTYRDGTRIAANLYAGKWYDEQGFELTEEEIIWCDKNE